MQYQTFKNCYIMSTGEEIEIITDISDNKDEMKFFRTVECCKIKTFGDFNLVGSTNSEIEIILYIIQKKYGIILGDIYKMVTESYIENDEVC